jgi:hypothetical protein
MFAVGIKTTFRDLAALGYRRFTRLTNAFSKKWKNSLGRSDALIHALQLLPDSQVAARYSGYGGGNCGSRAEYRRTARLRCACCIWPVQDFQNDISILRSDSNSWEWLPRL